jgi:hypothetical protein
MPCLRERRPGSCAGSRRKQRGDAYPIVYVLRYTDSGVCCPAIEARSSGAVHALLASCLEFTPVRNELFRREVKPVEARRMKLRQKLPAWLLSAAILLVMSTRALGGAESPRPGVGTSGLHAVGANLPRGSWQTPQPEGVFRYGVARRFNSGWSWPPTPPRSVREP